MSLLSWIRWDTWQVGFCFQVVGFVGTKRGSWRSAWVVIPWPLIITCAVLLMIIIYDVKINYCFGKWTKFRIELKDLNCNITKMIRETLCLDKKKSISSGRWLFHKGIENDFNKLLKLLNSSFIQIGWLFFTKLEWINCIIYIISPINWWIPH